MNNSNSCRRLNVYWLIDNLKISNHHGYDDTVKYLLSEMNKSIPDLPKSGKNLDKLNNHIKVILCNLHCAYDTLDVMYIAFQKAGSAYKHNPAYKGFQFSHQNIKRVANFLHENGYIEFFPGYPGSEGKSGHLSKMKATPKLIDLLAGKFHADPETIYRDISHEESIILKGKKKLPPKSKWKDGKKPKPKRKPIATPNNPAVRQMRANLETINKVIQQSKIELDMDLYELEQLCNRLAKDPDKYKRPVDFTQKTLYRVFIDGSLETHGRFYGGWYEGISEEDREKILINGMPTVELDFKSLHPYILYGIEQVEPSMKDLYYLEGESEQENQRLRPLIKWFLLIMFNAKSENGAIRALRDKYSKEKDKAERRGKPIPEPPFPINKANMQPIIQKLRKQHPAISKYCFSDCGNMLMYHDSRMAEEVMLKFAEQGVACLPVHDSFIVDIRYVEQCWEYMRWAYYNRFDQQIPIDVIDEVLRVKKIIDGSRVLPMNKEWGKMAGKYIYGINTGDPIDI